MLFVCWWIGWNLFIIFVILYLIDAIICNREDDCSEMKGVIIGINYIHLIEYFFFSINIKIYGIMNKIKKLKLVQVEGFLISLTIKTKQKYISL